MDAGVELQLELIKQVGAVLIAVVGVIGSAFIILLNRTRQHAKAAREQVENNHKTNLRDEADQRHTANTGRLSILETRTTGIERSLGRIEDHLGIERTMPRPPQRRKK